MDGAVLWSSIVMNTARDTMSAPGAAAPAAPMWTRVRSQWFNVIPLEGWASNGTDAASDECEGRAATRSARTFPDASPDPEYRPSATSATMSVTTLPPFVAPE